MTKRKPKQMMLDVRRYVVSVHGFDPQTIQAGSPGSAKWKTFKLAREAGFFREGFHAFLANGVTAREDTRPDHGR